MRHLGRHYRNIGVLALAYGLFMSVQGMGAATIPLAGYMVLGEHEKALATIPIFLIHLGIMGTSVPASLLMAVIGRRAGFSVGAIVGMISGIFGCLGLYERSFGLLCLAAAMQGMQAGFFWYFRLAAADSIEPAYRARAISLVMAGGVIAGFFGPQTAKSAASWLEPVTFAGVYLAMSGFSFLIFALVQFLHIEKPSSRQSEMEGRPLRVIMRQPTYQVALVSSAIGYGVMTLTMSATPLAMLLCGYGFAESATVIQAHIVAMFLPAFFTGHLIKRFGVLPVIMAGGMVEAGCALVNLSGSALINFFVANILVGVGWNFAYVGGSTLLTSTYTSVERAKVQASHDFTVYSITATAAAVSGMLQANAGWMVINLMILPLTAAVLAAATWLLFRQRHANADWSRA
jgi:MFS family permease